MWAIIALSSLAGLAIFLLMIPLDMVMRLEAYGKPKFRARFVWLWGLLSQEIKKKPKKIKKEVPEKEKLKKKKGKASDFVRILRIKGLFKHLKRLIGDILGHLSFRDLKGEFKFGFGDPADTGLFFGFLGPAIQFSSPHLNHRLNIKPSFGPEPKLEGYLQGTLRLIPILLVPAVLRFVFSPITVRLIKVFIQSKWKQRKK